MRRGWCDDSSRRSIHRSVLDDPEALKDDSLQSRTYDEVERVGSLGKQAKRRSARRIDQAKCLAQDEMVVLREYLRGDVHQQPELA